MNNAPVLTRNSSIELLRLVLMFMIIIHHSIVHGMGLFGLVYEDARPMNFGDWEKPVAVMLNCMCICAVNCFVLISGYFSIKTNSRKFITILISVLFYTFLLGSVFYLFNGNVKRGISCMMIFSHPTYWFVNVYIYLMLFAPALNLVFEKSSKGYLEFLLLVFLFISCYLGFLWGNDLNANGYNLFQLILMYSIGRYIRLYNIDLTRRHSLLVFLISAIAIGCIMLLLWSVHNEKWAWQMTNYNNPLVIMASIGLFMLFKSFKFESKAINRLAMSSFAIYLIQSSYPAGEYYYDFINWLHIEVGGLIWLFIFVFAGVIIAFSIVFDQIVQRPVNLYFTEKFINFVSRVRARVKF